MRLSTVFALSLALLAPAAVAAPPANDHPILGIWLLSLPDGSCAEIYRFRGDGTSFVTSADEVSESEFNIPAKPDASGFYKLEDHIVKGNGKKDCGGSVTKIGTRATHFVQFHPSGSLFVMCIKESLDACIGPFLRMPGRES
ncbi:hypothetical protein [Massilia sp. CF038]|uniref:hypothetical protein n=1 Tax=Massilia sp. CF038 TaxID=1881045 RepID=UPI00091B6570|nr:hypothetical protein [Massilia sp. CF038]SHG57097.1 hypothetical protein SAMN05428948_1080 [Massilia sp. CF038]